MSGRWIVIIAGVVLLLYGWFSSDEGMARAKLRRRREQLRTDWGETAADTFGAERDPSVRETVGGGVDRFWLLVVGVILVVAGIFWDRMGAFLGQYFEVVQ